MHCLNAEHVQQVNDAGASAVVAGNPGATSPERSISAVMAVYNPDPHLFGKALSSVLDQSLPVLELVLVNDGGSEEFRDVLPYDDRIRVFSKPNEGVAATRNFAIGQCRGEFIAFLDQDDFWYPDKLEQQMAMISPHGNPCMVVSSVDVVDGDGVKIDNKSAQVHAHYQYRASGGDVLEALADDNFIYSSTPLVHREIFRCTGGFDVAAMPHDDWDMYLRIAQAGFPIYCHAGKPLSVWRVHDSNESRKRMAMMQSKCVVEEKALRCGAAVGIERILRSNLSLDRVLIGNLLYNDSDYAGFRVSLRMHLPELLKMCVAAGRNDRFVDDFRKRARKAIVKSVRRFFLSYFIPAQA
jgi:glycosyltransferase involved in cell wall biosynthesis